MSDAISNGEEAFKALVDALALTGTRGTESVAVAILTGQEDDQKTLPRVVCAIDSNGGREVVLFTGNYEHRGFIEIVTHPVDEGLTVHRARVQAVADALQMDDISSQLSAAVTPYHCYQVRWQSPSPQSDGNSLITRLPFDIVHCCTDL